MARVFRTEAGTTKRRRILRGISGALRHAAASAVSHDERLDILAFIAQGLAEIAASVDESASAWEKRGYWVKADRFRQDWAWAERASASMEEALERGNWAEGESVAAGLAGRLQMPAPRTGSGGQVWRGAWRQRTQQDQ